VAVIMATAMSIVFFIFIFRSCLVSVCSTRPRAFCLFRIGYKDSVFLANSITIEEKDSQKNLFLAQSLFFPKKELTLQND
jgi:hypothetical protein